MDDLFLDTSYLLPVFGVKLEYRDFEIVFARLHERFTVMYSPISLVEVKLVILKHSRKSPDQRDRLFQSFRRGLLSLEGDARIHSSVLTNDRIEELSDALLVRLNVSDYFDRQIYSTAAISESLLLTEDESLHGLQKKARDLPKPKAIMRWKDLLKK